MRAHLAMVVMALALGGSANAGVVEEETWYNAEGQVVKTVKRTLTGAAARRAPDWEPAWVLRERGRGDRGPVRYASPRRYYGPSYYGSSYFYPFATRYCGSRRYGGAGLTGFIRAGSGRTGWGLGYRGSGVNLFLTR